MAAFEKCTLAVFDSLEVTCRRRVAEEHEVTLKRVGRVLGASKQAMGIVERRALGKLHGSALGRELAALGSRRGGAR